MSDADAFVAEIVKKLKDVFGGNKMERNWNLFGRAANAVFKLKLIM
jgi:hypothetical protein